MLACDFVLKPALHIRYENCDRFMQGAFIPENDQIILCSNVLVEKTDYDNAMKRHLIRLYDYKRSENYNFDNCKHLACTEVRAALFHSHCNAATERSQFASTFSSSASTKARTDANEFCVREKAIEMLSERDKCSAKAERYVDYVFDKCKTDTAPFSVGSSKRRQVRNLTNVL